MGVPVAGEPGPRARAFQVGVDRLAGADLAVLEVGGGQETVRRRASDPVDVNDAGRISGWTWGDCCELQSLWVAPGLRGRGLATRLIAAAEAEAAARGCSQTVHFTYAFQARALYE